MDRRRFLGNVSLAAGGVAGSWLPALLQAAPAVCMADTCGDWQLDDICLAYPPYSMHMQSAVPPATVSAAADPVDSHWVA